MERKFKFSEGEYYHLYNRGVNKMRIFLNNRDKDRFLKLLFVCNSTKPITYRTIKNKPLEKINRGETLTDIGCYCLMNNHFHILVREKKENGISIFMQKLCTAYSMYFNKKNERTGGIFEGTFHATHAKEDEYLKYLFSYIHLNPIKFINPKWKKFGVSNMKKTKEYLKKYKYSSYIDYLGIKRSSSLVLDKEKFPEYFENFSEFNNFIDEWLIHTEV